MHATRILTAALVLAAGSALPLQAQDRLTIGQTVRGTLTESSPTLEDGSHYRLYRMNGRAGETVTITLRSDDFDAYLAVGRMSGGELDMMETDDDGAGGTDSEVVVTFPSNGEYVVRANTLSEGETGDYTLAVAAGGEDSADEDDDAEFEGDIVGMLLEASGELMEAAGMSAQGTGVRGSLAEGATQEVTVRVTAAQVVGIMGVCDESCSDLDLTVFGPNGSEVGADVLPDDSPIVRLENPRSGTYRVRVTMTACEEASCDFGVRVFGGGN